MIPVILAVCAMHFSVAKPPPDAWLHRLKQRTGCTPTLVRDYGKREVLPVSRLNDFFPHTTRYWPLLDARRVDLVAAAHQWLQRGITPGIVLPSTSTVLPDAQLDNVRKLAGSGVAFVLSAPARGRSFGGKATLYAALGILVNGIYLDRGYNPDLETLPKGLYLVAPHWQNRPDLPLARTEWTDHGRHFIVLPSNHPPANSSAADAAPPPGTPYTPMLGQSWQFAGIHYAVDGDGEHSSVLGWAMQPLIGLIAPLERLVRTPAQDFAVDIGVALAWIGIIFGIFSILVLVFGAFRISISHEHY